MALLEHDLWCSVTEGSGHCTQNSLVRVQHLRDTKISKNKGRVCGFCKVKEVFGFQVYTSVSSAKAGLHILYTSVDDIIVVEIVNSLQDLPYRPSGVFLSKLAVLADAVEELPACSKLSDNVVFILFTDFSDPSPREGGMPYLRLEPVMKTDDMWVFYPL